MNQLTNTDLQAAHDVLDEMIIDVKTGKITYADDILQALMMITDSGQRTLAILLTVALQRLAR